MAFGTARTILSAHAGRTVQETVHISVWICGVLTCWGMKIYLRTCTVDDKSPLHIDLNNDKEEEQRGKDDFARLSQCSAYVISVP